MLKFNKRIIFGLGGGGKGLLLFGKSAKEDIYMGIERTVDECGSRLRSQFVYHLILGQARRQTTTFEQQIGWVISVQVCL